jgi:dihydrofolate reductase
MDTRSQAVAETRIIRRGEAGYDEARHVWNAMVDRIADLKRQDAKDIAVHGNATLVRTLMEHDLIDALRLMVFPIVVGKGKLHVGGERSQHEATNHRYHHRRR